MKLAQNEIQDIIHYYSNEHLKIYEMIPLINQSYYTIYKALLNTKYSDIAKQEKIDFENLVVNDYLSNNISQKDIGLKYNMSRNEIYAIIKKNKLTRKDKKQSAYKMKIDYFDEIDTQNKAYILGLLAADGCLASNYNYSIQLSLQERDKEILDKISIEVGATQKLRKIIPNKGTPQYRLILQNKYMYYSIIKKGITPRKSLTLEYPICIPDRFQKDFIRGYFDGDGSISKSKNDTQVNVGILGTKMFLDNMIKIIENQTGICFHMYKCKKSDVTKVISIHSNRMAKIFFDWLYDSDGFYLERKHNKYIEYFYDGNKSVAA